MNDYLYSCSSHITHTMNTFQARETLLTSLIPTQGLGLHLRLVPLQNIPTTKLQGLYLCQYAAEICLPLELLEQLVATGASPAACTQPSDSPVATYARKGELGQVCFLLQYVPQEQAEAALLEACSAGHLLVARALLGHCRVNELHYKDGEYTCPLEAAVESGHLALVKMLIQAGATANALPRGRLLRAASDPEVRELVHTQFSSRYERCRSAARRSHDSEDEEDETYSYETQATTDADEELEWGSGDEEVRAESPWHSSAQAWGESSMDLD